MTAAVERGAGEPRSRGTAEPDSGNRKALNQAESSVVPPPDALASLPLRLFHLHITVRDQGRGIPQDKLNLIFERFQQVDASDARAKGGTGLGLSICRQIVQQHGGKIWAESTPGEGSSFHVTLPLSDLPPDSQVDPCPG